MNANPTGEEIRKVLLEEVMRLSAAGPGGFQSDVILNEAARKLNLRNNLEREQALLTYWSDLFRSGYLAWGYNISNSKAPFLHITEQGRRTLANISRDPANPDGYLAHIRTLGPLDAIAESYLEEALTTYNAACYKACAVMIGCAAERLVLNIRDVLVARITSLGKTPSDKLQTWQIKRVLDGIKGLLDAQKGSMADKMWDDYNAYWPALTQQIRTVRNESGHPTSIMPVSQDLVHASLLLFPHLLKLSYELEAWIANNYK